MPALGEPDSGGDWRRLLSLAGGVAALLAGLLVLTAGAARLGTTALESWGLPTAAARQIAIATVSTLPPVVLGGLLVMTKPEGTGRLVGLGGVALALTGVAIGLPLGFGSTLPLVALIYATGVFFVLASLLMGLVDGDGLPGTSPEVGPGSDQGTAMYRSTGSEALPADGGSEDDDIEFLLDDEDRD
jgi:hypothetical protein